MNPERIQELAAMAAVGALDGQDLIDWEQYLAQGDPSGPRELAAFRDAMATSGLFLVGSEKPSPSLKGRILEKVRVPNPKATETIVGQPGFNFIWAGAAEKWKALPVPGAFVQLLSTDPARGYAVLLGKLEPGTHYPPHIHSYSEQIYVLTGDLRISDQVLRAGDFHSAAAGTKHGDNYSEEGCTILAVLSLDHPLTQFAMA